MTERSIPDWVVTGAAVVERSSTWGPTYRYGQPKKITKVYKTGNFVVDGGDKQWSPRGGHATKTGSPSYSSSRISLVPLTDEVRAEIEQNQRYEAAVAVVKAEADRLEKVWRRQDIDETIAEADVIRASRPNPALSSSP